MAVRVLRENNRSEGRLPKTGVVIIQGEPLIFDTATTWRLYDAAALAAGAVVYGIAAESTGQLPIAPANGLTAGQGYDYTNFARGGLVGAFITGSELELFDDGHGLPYLTGGSESYALNAPVYADVTTGKVTSLPTGNSDAIGTVVDFDSATVPTRLRVKFSC
jgi:hypothetical protein